MASPQQTQDRRTARERLLAAADELFYAEGVHTVGIDRIIERAGVAKASLYTTFGSKDELVRAYLDARRKSRQDLITRAIAPYGEPVARILAVFDVLDRIVQEPGFRGCAFVNASAESRPGESIEGVSRESRSWTRSLFVGLAGEAGARDPDVVGAQLQVLYDGAMVSAQLDRDHRAARTARSMAAVLLAAAVS